MRTLELFAGTQSFSKRMNAETKITVDILDKFNPTHKADILTWDYRIYPPGHFDIVWCSPPCTEYSKAKTHGVRNLELADNCVRRCFEIIDYFQPRVWLVENPATGLLLKRMESIRPGIQYYIADYCAYGAPYRKRTAFWCNIPLELYTCFGTGKCHSMDGNKHIGSCGNGTTNYNSIGITSVWEKDAIPEYLIDNLIDHFLEGLIAG
jgi:hypothetical protein